MLRARATWVPTLLGASVLALAAAAPWAADQDYSEQGANACLDCHESPEVMGILDTPHADASNPKTPAGQKECQSCHGPSATHMEFPMQVANVHFGKESKATPQRQNEACLECHADGAREHWQGSAHGYEDVRCSECHSAHKTGLLTPPDAEVLARCDSCHDDLLGSAKPADFTHPVGFRLGESETLTCATCHNPHGPLESSRCDSCHPSTAEAFAEQTEKARRFHEVGLRRGTECIRCHKAIAHPISEPELSAVP